MPVLWRLRQVWHELISDAAHVLTRRVVHSALLASRYPVGARQWHARHGGGLDRQRDQVFGLEIVQVALAAGARDGLRLQRQHRQIIGQPAARRDRIEPRRQHRDPGW